MTKPKILDDVSGLKRECQKFKDGQLAGMYYIPSSHIENPSTITTASNPLPTSWRAISEGMKYNSNDYVITASSHDGINGVQLAFDGNPDTKWISSTEYESSIVIELPNPIKVTKLKLNYNYSGSPIVNIQGSNDNSIWQNLWAETSKLVGLSEITLRPADIYKYYRIRFYHIERESISEVSEFQISEYERPEYILYHTIDGLPTSLTHNQRLMLRTPEYEMREFSYNYLNNISIDKILAPNKFYELMYTGTSFKVMSSSDDIEEAKTDLRNSINQNLSLIESMQRDINALYSQLGGLMEYVPVKDLPIGTEVYLYESGVLTPFILVHKNYKTANDAILMRKYLLPSMNYNLGSTMAHYGDNTEIDTYLTGTYQPSLSVTYSPININVSLRTSSNAVTISRSVFLPSLTELTGDGYDEDNNYNYIRVEGTQFNYFVNNPSLISLYNGEAKGWHLRTICNNYNNYYVHSTGVIFNSSFSTVWHLRPCISILNTTSVYVKLLATTNNVVATAEVIE